MSTFPSSPKPVVKPTGNSLFGFRTRLLLTWLALFGLFVAFFLSFDLKFSIILEKFPNLAGFKPVSYTHLTLPTIYSV